MTTYKFELDLIVKKEAHDWIAQCTEHDIIGQGSTPKKAVQDFQRGFMATVLLNLSRERTPMFGVPRTPKICLKNAGKNKEAISSNWIEPTQEFQWKSEKAKIELECNRIHD